ncbi:MAG: hypothetical protein FJ265_15105 [Planctomycetes bacterium]|nr:hypothetical protein [Planctomycetota bacterium]
MSETPPPAESPKPEPKPFTPIFHTTDFRGLLEEHLGKIFSIANPESLEETGLGRKITAGWYKARLIGLGADYLIVLTEFTRGTGKAAEKEPVKQFIPLGRIKRMSLMQNERMLHL